MGQNEAPVSLTIREVVEHEVQATPQDIGHAIMAIVWRECGQIDDAGCDWYTAGDAICIAEPGWHVVTDFRLARLVDAANLLMLGHTMELSPEDVMRAGYPVKDTHQVDTWRTIEEPVHA